jgi:hypothetical protein
MDPVVHQYKEKGPKEKKQNAMQRKLKLYPLPLQGIPKEKSTSKDKKKEKEKKRKEIKRKGDDGGNRR